MQTYVCLYINLTCNNEMCYLFIFVKLYVIVYELYYLFR